MRAIVALLLLLAACRGPAVVDYEAQTGETAAPGLDGYQELPLARLASSPRGSAQRQAFERVQEAVDLANRFAASDWNHFYPRGCRFRLTEAGVLRLESEADRFDVHIWISAWGTLVNQLGFSAQETADGFVVGRFQDPKSKLIDAGLANSFFMTLEGAWRDPSMIAALMLHEMSHTLQVRTQGQLSYWLEYYFAAVILFQGGDEANDLEKVPYRVEAEFWRWLAARA